MELANDLKCSPQFKSNSNSNKVNAFTKHSNKIIIWRRRRTHKSDWKCLLCYGKVNSQRSLRLIQIKTNCKVWTWYLPVFGVKCSDHWVLHYLKLLIIRFLWRLLFLLQFHKGRRCGPVPPLDVGLEPSTHRLHFHLHRSCSKARVVRLDPISDRNNKILKDTFFFRN